jgi:hypothetical protein
VYCVKSPFTLIVIPGLTRNPLPTGRQECFQSGFPLEFTPYLIRGGNDGFGTYVKKRWTQNTKFILKVMLLLLPKNFFQKIRDSSCGVCADLPFFLT